MNFAQTTRHAADIGMRILLSIAAITCCCCMDLCSEEEGHHDEPTTHGFGNELLVLTSSPSSANLVAQLLEVTFSEDLAPAALSTLKEATNITPSSGAPPPETDLLLRSSRLLI